MSAQILAVGEAKLHAIIDALHANEARLNAEVVCLKDELLEVYRRDTRLLSRAKVKARLVADKPVSAEESRQMGIMKVAGASFREIGRRLNRSASTVRYALVSRTDHQSKKVAT